MIDVKQLTRRYGQHRGVSDLNFQIEPGQIIGLLGPNGAGKSTTIRVLCTQLLPSEGRVTVFGKDIVENALEIRQLLGYLPENAPLYHDMITQEYLAFVAKLHGLNRNDSKEAIERVSQICDLNSVLKRPLSEVSRGYRQRTGLAAAILHKPKILILDEPTASLDPNQVADVHQLIRDLSQDITIIFSSHILSEVEELCERVIILNQGKIVADNTPSKLREGDHIQLEAKASSNELKKILKDFGHIKVIQNNSDHTYIQIQGNSSLEQREKISRVLAEANIYPSRLQPGEYALSQIFTKLTEEAK